MVKAYNNAGALVAYPGENEAAPTVGNHRAFAVTGTTVNTFAASTAAQSPIPDLETEASSSSAYQIKYTGDLVEENTEIATFTVTWNNDPQAVPGEYEAYITLSVSAL